uniref:Transposase, is66 family n=1 Tax=wastewater metagenome TaxID=527639 RepID=A0A0A8KWP7_9ZZZZ
MSQAHLNPNSITTLEEAIAVIRILVNRVNDLEKENAELKEEIAILKKNSGTSSKPPSSDITKPKSEQRQSGKRKIGGQKGHPRHNRTPFTEEELDDVIDLKPISCPCCGDRLEYSDAEIKIQQSVELKENPVEKIEYRRHPGYCPNCQKIHYEQLPANIIPNQLLGVRLLSLLGYMKGSMGVSMSELQEFIKNILGLKLSSGYIVKSILRVSKALKKPYEEVLDKVTSEEQLNIDESGWPDSGNKLWVWLFCSAKICLFAIRNSRGTKVLKEILGETFDGAITSDFYSAYVCFANAKQQFCLAHLIRDVKFLTTLPSDETKEFGEAILKYFRSIFVVWHEHGSGPPDVLRKKVKRIQRKMFTFLLNTKPTNKHVTNITVRMTKHWDSLFRFVDYPDQIQPTNNNAERSLRHLVRIRKVSQGTRGDNGQRWTERVMTVMSTCKRQNINPWNFIQSAVTARFLNAYYPCLIP